MGKYINEIIDIIENHPALNKQEIIEKFCKNTDRKFTTPELQDIYKKAKESSQLQVKQAVPQVQPKPRGAVPDATASSYLPRNLVTASHKISAPAGRQYEIALRYPS